MNAKCIVITWVMIMSVHAFLGKKLLVPLSLRTSEAHISVSSTDSGLIQEKKLNPVLVENLQTIKIDSRVPIVHESTFLPTVVWMDLPGEELKTLSGWKKYYSDMFSFVVGNHLKTTVTDIILQVDCPDRVTRDGFSVWGDVLISPMYTDLISRLDVGVGLKFYPSLASLDNRRSFGLSSNRSDTLEGVFAFASYWNSELVRLGHPTAFTEVVLNQFEITDNDVMISSIHSLKKNNGIAKVGVLLDPTDVYRFFQLRRRQCDMFYMDLSSRSAYYVDSKIMNVLTNYGHEITALWPASSVSTQMLTDTISSVFPMITTRGIYKFDRIPSSWTIP